MPKKALHDIAPKIRAGFVRAASRKGGGNAEKAIADQIVKLWDDDFLAVLSVVSKFTVREATVSGEIDHNHTHEHRAVSETASWIEELVASGSDTAPEKPVSH